MTVLAILGGLLVIAAVSIAIYRVREYALENYDYKIEKTGYLFLIPALLFGASFIFPSVEHIDLNAAILISLTVISSISIFLYTAKKTNWGIAIFSSFFAIVSIPVAAILFVLLVVLMGISDTGKERRVIIKEE
jgi:hypothetical protein